MEREYLKAAPPSNLGGSVSAERKDNGTVSMYPCSQHGGRVPGKLASVYWRWFDQEGESIGFKQRLCSACAKDGLRSLLAHASGESTDVSVCPVCGSDSSKDMEPVYLTVYTPGSEGREFQLPICSGCAASVHATAMKGSERLPDRGRSRGAMAPREPEDPFEDLWS